MLTVQMRIIEMIWKHRKMLKNINESERRKEYSLKEILRNILRLFLIISDLSAPRRPTHQSLGRTNKRHDIIWPRGREHRLLRNNSPQASQKMMRKKKAKKNEYGHFSQVHNYLNVFSKNKNCQSNSERSR